MFAATLSEPPAVRRGARHDDFLTTAELAKLTSHELTRRTVALGPFIAAHAAEAERLRRPVEAVWSALRASGFFYQFVPRHFGGLGSDTDSFIDAALPIAEACPATAWVACFCAGHNRTLAQFPDEVQAEIWGGDFPYIIAPTLGAPPGRAVPVAGGYRITGTWSWASGIMDADWVLAVALLAVDNAAPQPLMTLFPADQAEIIDTWHMDGLAGSGSNDVRVTDLFVPERRGLTGPRLANGYLADALGDEPVFGTPLFAFSCLAAAIPILGSAKGAFSLFRIAAAARRQPGMDVAQALQPVAQVRMAEAQLMIETAELIIRKNGRRAVAVGAAPDSERTALRISIRAQFAYAVQLCRQAVLKLAETAGSSAHRLDHGFQRHLRDIGIMASHVGFDVDLAYALHGRVLVGLEPNSPLF